MRHVTGICLAIIIPLLLLLGGCGHEEPPVVIGAILPTSGSGATTGEAIWQGMNAYIEKVNARGGIDDHPVSLVLKGIETDPEAGKRAFHDLEKEDVLMVVSTLSSISTAIAPLAEQAGIPMLALAASSNRVESGREWVFSFFPDANLEAKGIVSSMSYQGVNSLALIHLDDEYGQAMASGIAQQVRGRVETISSSTFSYKTRDFQGLLAPHLEADAICLIGFSSHIIAALRDLDALEYEGIVLAPSTAGASDVITMPEAEGMLISVLALYKPSYSYAQEFMEQFPDPYQISSINGIAYGYEGMKLFSELMQGRDKSRKSLRAALASAFVYPGILGTVDKKGGEHRFSFPLYPGKVRGGQVVFR